MPQLSPMNWMLLSIMPMMIIKTLLLISQPLSTENNMKTKKIKTTLNTWMW